MTSRGTTTNHALRRALLQLLAPGRAITTAELRTRLSDDTAFSDVTQEAVYRHLDALARAGSIRRVTHPGRRHIFWSRRPCAVSAALPQE
ncbi:MAG: helix-turn-helix domain-containing protein [Mycolicibacterium sp.]|uniref:helix-turn-helix domain-containing protein n=1 Tax=Mycolicibacterium sp. TaxID=2320850 RepID=UPI003D0F3425